MISRFVRGFIWRFRYLLRNLPSLATLIGHHEARGLIRIVSAWHHWVSATDSHAALKKAPDEKQAALYVKLHETQIRRWRITAVLTVIFAGLFLYLWVAYSYTGIVALIVTMFGIAYLVGRVDPPDGESSVIRGPIVAGMPLSEVRGSIREIMEVRCRTKADVSVAIAPNGWTFTLSFLSPRPDDDKIIRELEQGLGSPHNSILLIEDPENAARELGTIQLTDPLVKTPPFESTGPNSRSIQDAFPLGMNQDGSVLKLNLLRTNWLFVGRSDSGKSSALNSVGVRLAECSDVVINSIDITGAVTFAVHRGCVRNRVETPEEAISFLKDELKLIDERTRQMAGDIETGDVVSALSPTPDLPARIILIDELPALSQYPEFVQLLLLYLMRGRKVCCTAVIGTQGVSERVAGSATFRECVHGTVMFGCGERDIKNALGQDARNRGWRPDTLTLPGSCYIKGPGRQLPAVSRFSHIDVQSVADLSLELQHHQPRLPVPAVLQSCLDAFDDMGSDFCDQETLVTRTGLSSKQELKTSLERYGVKLRQNGKVAGRPRGYFRDDVKAAAQAKL